MVSWGYKKVKIKMRNEILSAGGSRRDKEGLGGMTPEQRQEYFERERGNNLGKLKAVDFGVLREAAGVGQWSEVKKMNGEQLAEAVRKYEEYQQGTAAARAEFAGVLGAVAQRRAGEAAMVGASVAEAPAAPPVNVGGVPPTSENIGAGERERKKLRNGKIGRAVIGVMIALTIIGGVATVVNRGERTVESQVGIEYAVDGAEEGERLVADTSGYVGFAEDGDYAIELDNGTVINNPNKSGPAAFGESLGKDEAAGKDLDRLSAAEVEAKGGSATKYYNYWLNGHDGVGGNGMFYAPASEAKFVDLLTSEQRAALGISEEDLKDLVGLENKIEDMGPEARGRIGGAIKGALDGNYTLALEAVSGKYYTSMVRGDFEDGKLESTTLAEAEGNGSRICLAWTHKITGEKVYLAVSCGGQRLFFLRDGTPVIVEEPPVVETPPVVTETPPPVVVETPPPTSEETPPPVEEIVPPEETPPPETTPPTTTTPPVVTPPPTVTPPPVTPTPPPDFGKTGDPHTGSEVSVDTDLNAGVDKAPAVSEEEARGDQNNQGGTGVLPGGSSGSNGGSEGSQSQGNMNGTTPDYSAGEAADAAGNAAQEEAQQETPRNDGGLEEIVSGGNF